MQENPEVPYRVITTSSLPEARAYMYEIDGKNYQMLDFWLSYKTKIAPQHYISPVVGVSHCWGLDYYYYSHVVLSPIESETLISNNKAQYNGIIGGVTYDYYFLNNRLNIGADILFRYYPQRIKQQYDSGIHIGFCF